MFIKTYTYKDLIVWQKSMDLVVAVYELTIGYPNSELYGLVVHTRKTAVSIPSNIAEGRRRGSRKDYRVRDSNRNFQATLTWNESEL